MPEIIPKGRTESYPYAIISVVMSNIPVTSISLIQAIANDPQSARWEDLYTIYEKPMRAFLQARFPTLEPEDVIQETMLALMKALPGYSYTPDAKGHFHNYLTGILKHKAMDALAARSREALARADLAGQPAGENAAESAEEAEWRQAALEVALAQLLADKSINPLHRTVFEHLVLQHEKPEDVAAALGTSRANVDVIKKRMIERLSEMVEKLTAS